MPYLPSDFASRKIAHTRHEQIGKRTQINFCKIMQQANGAMNMHSHTHTPRGKVEEEIDREEKKCERNIYRHRKVAQKEANER